MNTWRQVWKRQCSGHLNAGLEGREVASSLSVWWPWITCLHFLILISERRWLLSPFQWWQCRILIQIGPKQQLLGASQVLPVVKNPPASAGDARDTGLIPGWGRSPGGGHGNPLQNSTWRIPWTGSWWSIVHSVAESPGHDWNNLARTHAYTASLLIC